MARWPGLRPAAIVTEAGADQGVAPVLAEVRRLPVTSLPPPLDAVALAELADSYRGETVVVVADVVLPGVPRTSSAVVVAEYDENGWRSVDDDSGAGLGADAFAEPSDTLADPAELFVHYLDYYRAAIVRKLDGLSDTELRTSRLPSGWTPIEMLSHLVHMERRWMRWGFAAEPVDDPWGDRVDDRWHVGTEVSLDDLVVRLVAGGEYTRQVVRTARLDDTAAVGVPFDGSQPPPTLAWILFHVLQEYARHAGHLDIARELADGATGE